MQKIIFSLVLMLSMSWSVQAQSLRIGLSADYPPLHYRHSDRIVGIEPDNAVAVGKITGRDIELVVLEFNELIPALAAGKIDIIMSGLSITPERSEQVMFVDPYLDIGQMAIMHRDKLARFAQPWSIYREGIRIGVELGTTGETYVLNDLKDAQLHRYDNPELAFEALRADQIDLFIHDAPTSWQLAQSSKNDDLISLYRALTDEQLAWAVRLGRHALLQELNDALRVMRTSGTLPYILNRWIPVQIEVK